VRGIYTASVTTVSLTANKAILFFSLPATCAVEIHSVHVTNKNNATNQQLECSCAPVTTIGTPADTSTVVIGQSEARDQASLIVDATNIFGDLTSETATVYGAPIDTQSWPSLSGYHYEPAPDDRPTCPPSKAWAVRLLTIAFTATIFLVECTFREIS